MNLKEACDQTGVTRKALRHYEQLGLIAPVRQSNGYRNFSDHDLRLIAEIRDLVGLGIPLKNVHPFVDCLNSGSLYVDACPTTLTEYRLAIERIDNHLNELSRRRAALVANLSVAADRVRPQLAESDLANPSRFLPAGLPIPEDDGSADHLLGCELPDIPIAATDGLSVRLGILNQGRVLIYVFPMTGDPTGPPTGDLPADWDSIPGARGCTPHNCDIRDHYAELIQSGVRRVFGLSSQPLEIQRRLAQQLRLPYPLLSDEDLKLASHLGLPTFNAGGLTLYRRMAMVIDEGFITKIFFPIFPPDQHAPIVLDWLAKNPISEV
jgi:peroxiredoxin/DNA-binding transcriptional MerR regulator